MAKELIFATYVATKKALTKEIIDKLIVVLNSEGWEDAIFLAEQKPMSYNSPTIKQGKETIH